MSAMYPGQYREWTEKYDYVTIVFADHFNTAQDETNALFSTVGLTPQIARNDPGSTPITLQPVVDWISNVPDEEIDDVIAVLEEAPNLTFEDLLDRLRNRWPRWGNRGG